MGKGTVSKIVSDDEFLRTEDGRVADIIVSPLAILGRTNISQMYESLLSLICVEFYNILDKWFKGDPKVRSEFKEEILQNTMDKLLYETEDGESKNIKDVYERSKKYGYIRAQVRSFDKYFTHDLLVELRDTLHIKDMVRVFEPISGRYIRGLVRIGYQSFLRLSFLPEKKMTSRGGNLGLNLKDRSPMIDDYGRVKSEGQKVGKLLAA